MAAAANYNSRRIVIRVDRAGMEQFEPWRHKLKADS
jgi:hypothetical protein